MDGTALLIIGIFVGFVVFPCLIVAGRDSRNGEICAHCIYGEFAGHDSPCCACVNSDHFERKVEDG